MGSGCGMKDKLSRVYLDDYPITLMGDESTPPLSRIVRAGGKHPDRVDILLLNSPSAIDGPRIGPEEIIDRTAEPTRPIYLRSVPKDGGKPIATVFPGPDEPAERKRPTPHTPGPNADPVITQLGSEPVVPQILREHEPGVFHSPSQDPPVPGAKASPHAVVQAKNIEDLAIAEDAAEQRQEDERNQEDTLQDDEEALAEADEDEAES
ncbi:MAG: hypothetical protein QOJ26_1930 [Thermoplasmata archaeon]|nr:hypothetical protein [Thermoplasmata archaeon]